MVDVPAIVRNKALDAGAGDWIRGLSDLIGDLEAEWGIRVGEPYGDGTEAFVARCTTDDGNESVLKLLIPRSGGATLNEIAVLQLAAGRSCVRLERHDLDRGALLMERLGPSLFELNVPVGSRHRILCDLASRLWMPAPECGLPTGAEKAAWLADHITSSWEQLDRPCTMKAVEHAVEMVQRRIGAHDDERARLVHGDVHQWNTLQAGDGFKLVDPDGLLAEPEYDLGIIMREDPTDLESVDACWERAHWLADRTGLDATAIWEWGVIERVSTGLLATRIDLQPVGRQMLAVADMIAE
ncbi:aminoglycoside phosphotransferase family protein [Ilumatobacter sp.]|uniref:aminoglycoside phosphotransferase family protein n=1 Tax=Ilumatobacter sp. TaxID=1967498 RepID=UPI003C549787